MEIEPSDPQMDGDSMNLSVMALSGGMDSTCLLLRLIAEGDEVIALSFRYGQRHVLELECAKRTVQMLRERRTYDRSSDPRSRGRHGTVLQRTHRSCDVDAGGSL